jgi:hypothetical protein
MRTQDGLDRTERDNMRTFCRVTGADFEVMQSPDVTRQYRFSPTLKIRTDFPPALGIRRMGRFGNNLRQILHAVHVAKSIGAARLYIGEVNIGRFTVPWAFGNLWLIPSPPPRDEPVLQGTFFYRNAFKNLFDKFDGARALAVVSGVITPMLRNRWGCSNAKAEDVLHIHIRSGDTFSGRSVHPKYVPPPVAYYLSAVRLFQMRFRWPKIVIVVEDSRNPSVAMVYRALRSQGLSVSLFCCDFERTVRELLSATNLVTSVGSFATMTALASEHITSVYGFKNIAHRDTFIAKGIDITMVLDGVGDYIPQGTWANTPWQVHQVLNYPASALRYVKCLPRPPLNLQQ